MSVAGSVSDRPTVDGEREGGATAAAAPATVCRREAVPRWLLLGVLIALGANMLASTMTDVTIQQMRSLTPFAETVRKRDLGLINYYLAVVYPMATLVVGI